MRLFIGIRTGCEDYLCGLQQLLKEIGRGNYTDRDNLHLTLKFLGEVPFSKLDSLREAIAETQAKAFTLECTGIQVFNKSGIISAKVGGETGKLQALQSGLETALERIGYAKEERPFRPHITLVRNFRPDRSFDISSIKCETFGFKVDEVILFESRRDAGKLVYVPLLVHKLNAAI